MKFFAQRFTHVHVSYETFFVRKFPDLEYITILVILNVVTSLSNPKSTSVFSDLSWASSMMMALYMFKSGSLRLSRRMPSVMYSMNVDCRRERNKFWKFGRLHVFNGYTRQPLSLSLTPSLSLPSPLMWQGCHTPWLSAANHSHIAVAIFVKVLC